MRSARPARFLVGFAPPVRPIKRTLGRSLHHIETEINIAATPERVWSILMDISAYPSWNPFIGFIKGSIETGQRLSGSIQPSGGKAMTFRPTVLRSTQF